MLPVQCWNTGVSAAWRVGLENPYIKKCNLLLTAYSSLLRKTALTFGAKKVKETCNNSSGYICGNYVFSQRRAARKSTQSQNKALNFSDGNFSVRHRAEQGNHASIAQHRTKTSHSKAIVGICDFTDTNSVVRRGRKSALKFLSKNFSAIVAGRREGNHP